MTMNKLEMIEAVKNTYEETTEETISKKMLEAVLRAYSDVVIANTTDEEAKVPMLGVGYFKTKFVPERSGISTLGEKKEWVSPAHTERVFKFSSACKKVED